MSASFRFSKTRQKWPLWLFQWTFVHWKCKRSSLRSQCWMRLLLWFSNTVIVISRFFSLFFSRYGTHFKSYELFHSCLNIFNSQTWNYVSLVILLVCFICHGLVLIHMFYTNNELRRKLKLEPTIFVIKTENNELKIPSRKTFPNSPIFPHNTNMVLTPIMEKKTTK